MRRALLALAVAGSAASVSAPAHAFVCPAGTKPTALPTGQTVCVPYTYCDPGPCRLPVEVHCPTDIPVWTSTCTRIFGWG
jgi:hypothetical protein